MAGETWIFIIQGVFGGLFIALFVIVIYTYIQTTRLMKAIDRLKQKDSPVFKFLSPIIQPDEELSKRGYSMYAGDKEDIESAGSSSYKSSSNADDRRSTSTLVFGENY